MDSNNNIVEGVSSDSNTPSFRVLKPLVAMKTPPEDLLKLWEALKEFPGNTDDVGYASPEFWVSGLYEVNSEHYTAPNAYVSVRNIIPKINADIHYAPLGPVGIGDPWESCELLREGMDELAMHLFQTYGLYRLTGYVPAPNKDVQRVVTIAGFKFEGEMRGMYLKNGVNYGLHIYGLTKDDFLKRRG